MGPQIPEKMFAAQVVEVCVNLPHSVFFGLFLGKTVEEALQNPRGFLHWGQVSR
jgi:hypothetical protein